MIDKVSKKIKKALLLILIFLCIITALLSCKEKNIQDNTVSDNRDEIIDVLAPVDINIIDNIDDIDDMITIDTDTGIDMNMPVEYEKIGDNELRGVWIASVLNIDFPSEPGISAEKMIAEIDEIIKQCKEANLNAIFFQVRPASDALYNSGIFPTSKYLVEKQGDPFPGGFDPLKYIIYTAHKNNIELHAWINPYRITNGTASSPEQDLNELAENNPARKNPEWTVNYPDGKLYYNPGIPEVRQLITDGVLEIIKNYDVDGIHFDDYFYPYPIDGAEFEDSEAFSRYGGEYDTIGDFRRENVNKLVRTVYEEIKKVNPDIRFGLSPFGIWANKSSVPAGSDTSGFESYSSLYSDAKAWVDGGYIDYICPQIYWAFSAEGAPYDVLVRWWSTLLDGTGVDLYIGHAVYKLNDTFQSELEIPRQVEYARSYISVKGSVFYGYADLSSNVYNVKDNLNKLFAGQRPIPKPVSNGSGIIIGRPADGTKITDTAENPISTINIMGGSDPAFPVYYNGSKAARTKSGFFSVFAGLEDGKNNIVLTQNGINTTHTINKTSIPTVYLQMKSYKIEIIAPKSDIITNAGDTIALKVQAPSKSIVTAKIGNISVNLNPLTFPPDNGIYMTEVYTGTFTMPAVNTQSDGQITDLGNIVFTAERNAESATISGINVQFMDESAYIPCEVIKDYTHIKIAPNSSFYDDYLPASIGMRDNIVGFRDGHYKLSFGGYVSQDDIIQTPDKPIQTNKILSSSMEDKGNITEIKFGVTENVPVDARCKDGVFTVTLYNTSDAGQILSLADNPLFIKSALSQNKENKENKEDNSVTYSFDLTDPDNFYGFEVVYENGFIILNVKNPMKKIEGGKPLNGLKIIVDAGHGGIEPGALGFLGTKGKIEKDLNLEIVLALQPKLTALGAEVIMIRETDETVDIYSRMDTLNKINPDLCVSVHHNSLGDTTDNSRIRGILALYCDDSGRLLSKSCSVEMSRGLNRIDRPARYQSLAMLRNHKFAAALLEMLFLTNPDEYETALEPATIQRSADAIANGIVAWVDNQSKFAG